MVGLRDMARKEPTGNVRTEPLRHLAPQMPKSSASPLLASSRLAAFHGRLLGAGVLSQHLGYHERWVADWLRRNLPPRSTGSQAQTYARLLEGEGYTAWQCRQAYQAVTHWLALESESQDSVEVPFAFRSWNEVLDRMVARLQTQRYSPRTIERYLEWGRRFAAQVPEVPQDGAIASRAVQDFLRHLALARNLSPASIAQARNALAMLFVRILSMELVLEERGDAHRGRRLPSVIAPSEVARLLRHCPPPWDLFFSIQYGCGLRLGELLEMRIGDIDLHRGLLTVRRGKGDKDRQIPFPHSLVARLHEHLEARLELWKDDLRQGYARVDLPFALQRKYPTADTSWEWQHLFGSARPLRHEPTGQLRRWHPMETLVREALRKAALQAGHHTRVHPHLLRHCYATHLLESGTSLREIQELMGHARIETTMVYLHVRSPTSTAASPLDLLRNGSSDSKR
jgi:integron integrase